MKQFLHQTIFRSPGQRVFGMVALLYGVAALAVALTRMTMSHFGATLLLIGLMNMFLGAAELLPHKQIIAAGALRTLVVLCGVASLALAALVR